MSENYNGYTIIINYSLSYDGFFFSISNSENETILKEIGPYFYSENALKTAKEKIDSLSC